MEKNLLNQFYIYQLNTRIFCIQNKTKLANISDDFFHTDSVKAADAVWLMGIWAPSPKSLEICRMHSGLQNEFQNNLANFTESDIIGSPYSIFEYTPNPLIAEHKLEIKQFRYKLNTLGKKLIVDFVPNHMAVDSPLITEYPEYFLYKKEKNPSVCKNSFLHPNGRIYFYGRDPFFDGWSDTVQWDFSHPEVIQLHKKILLELADISDGVRCDMAMLPLESIFKKTHGVKALPYWKNLISSVKVLRPDFIFIAEVYWNLEFELQQLGFDYTYDKTLYDRLKSKNTNEIFMHLQADAKFQNHSLRFLENHDEERALHYFGEESISYFSLLCFLSGSILYHDGQEFGALKKIPVQLGRKEIENNPAIQSFYTRAFQQIEKRFEKEIELIETKLTPYENDNLDMAIVKILKHENVLEVLIFNPYERIIYSKFSVPNALLEFFNQNFMEEIILEDLVTGKQFARTKKEILEGIHVQLEPSRAHWFVINF